MNYSMRVIQCYCGLGKFVIARYLSGGTSILGKNCNKCGKQKIKKEKKKTQRKLF